MTDATVEQRLGDRLRERGETLAVAESCTGGLVGSRVTDVAGASDYFVGGIVAYTHAAKRRLLAVTGEALDAHGAVSEPVAREMARHVRDESSATWGVSTTGYAGPSDGSDEPAGTVYVGVARGAPETDSVVERHQFDGERHAVKEQIATQAIGSTIAAIEA